MKTIYIAIFTLLLALPGAGRLFAQPTYDLQFRLEQNEAMVNGIYEVTAQIKANVDTFRMGSSNLVFTYNTDALNSPAPIGPGPDTLQIQAIHNFSGGDYAKMTLTEPAPGRMSLNIELFEPDSGAIVPMSFVDIATIRFTIEDETELSNLAWRSESPNPLTLFQNDEATVLNSASLADEVLLADLKVFLEGPYSGGSMITDLNTNGDLPTSQPYNVDPWNYSGMESVTDIPADVVDWVLLELRSGPLGTDSLTSRAAFIKNNGVIVDLNGISPVTFDVADNNYHVVVFHRNHLTAMNTNLMPLHKASNENPYDFTTGSGQFYGTDGAIELEPGVWGMIAGDTDASGTVDANDRGITWNDRNKSGYETGDCDLSGTVDANDRGITWNNRNKSTAVEALSLGNSQIIESDHSIQQQKKNDQSSRKKNNMQSQNIGRNN